MDNQAKRADDVEVTAPFGWKVRFPARSLTSAIVVIACVAALLYMLRDHDLEQTKNLQGAVSERTKQIDSVSLQQQKLQETMDTMVYVLTLPQDERQKLRLDMPVGLRSRLLNSERHR